MKTQQGQIMVHMLIKSPGVLILVSFLSCFDETFHSTAISTLNLSKHWHKCITTGGNFDILESGDNGK